MWPFRQLEIPPDRLQQHASTLDLIEQVAELRGRLRAMQSEWDDLKAQVKKGYQRMEKAGERAATKEEAKRLLEEEGIVEDEPVVEWGGFAKKLHDLKGA